MTNNESEERQKLRIEKLVENYKLPEEVNEIRFAMNN
jgi:hypothetical protein